MVRIRKIRCREMPWLFRDPRQNLISHLNLHQPLVFLWELLGFSRPQIQYPKKPFRLVYAVEGFLQLVLYK